MAEANISQLQDVSKSRYSVDSNTDSLIQKKPTQKSEPSPTGSGFYILPSTTLDTSDSPDARERKVKSARFIPDTKLHRYASTFYNTTSSLTPTTVVDKYKSLDSLSGISSTGTSQILEVIPLDNRVNHFHKSDIKLDSMIRNDKTETRPKQIDNSVINLLVIVF